MVFWKARGSNPGRERRFLFAKTFRPTMAHRDSYLIGGGSFPDVDRPRGEINHHSRPSGAKVENKWSYTSASAIFRADVGRGNFLLFYLPIVR